MIADLWHHPVTVNESKFVHKSLSNWSVNIAVGCAHACRFCYVPSVSTNKLKPALDKFGVHDPDAQWGDYVFPRTFDEKVFLRSLAKAEATPADKLQKDGNRAVMLCTTTDPYQLVSHPDKAVQSKINGALAFNTTWALELILEHSTLNVRILTRSPLARLDFDLMKRFGNRLLFGMSLPTLDNQLARVFEPHAPAPSKRLETLKAAHEAGLHVYVAVAPTYPVGPLWINGNGGDSATVQNWAMRQFQREQFKRLLEAIKLIEPSTIFHEPINIRADNVERIRAHAEKIGADVYLDDFSSSQRWASYAMAQLRDMEDMAVLLGLKDRLHLWPDKSLAAHWKLAEAQQWLLRCWGRVSEWPGK